MKASQVYGYDTVRIPFMPDLETRDTANTRDQILINCVVDMDQPEPQKRKKPVFVQKRGGFAANTTVVGAGGAGRGLYYWSRSNKTYSVIADKLYSNTSSIQTLTTSSGKCWFHEATGTSDVLIVCDGTKTYTVSTTDTVTEITDGDFPAGALSPVSIDGYVVVLKSGTDELYNSDVDAPTAWTAGNYLSAEMYPDNILVLHRQVNYIVAFGSFSVEFFYDNENASGSPFRRNEGVAIKQGLAARDSVGQIDKRIIFVGQSQAGEPSVWMFDGLTPSQVSSEGVNKILKAEGSNLTNATGYVLRHKGHALYILNLNARTIVYDMEDKFWMEWSINSSGNHAVLPFKYMTEGANGVTLVLHNTDGKIYELGSTTYQDDAGAILCHIQTNLVDLGTAQQKRLFRFELLADVQSTGTCTVEWSDDDGNNWNTARTLDLTTRPYTKACGVFRRRIFRIKHTANYPFRVMAFEIDFSLGVH